MVQYGVVKTVQDIVHILETTVNKAMGKLPVCPPQGKLWRQNLHPRKQKCFPTYSKTFW